MTRREVYEKFNGKCAYCGKNIEFDDMTLDHVHPHSKGGTKTIENIYPCCHLCNVQKGSKSVEEFRKYLEEDVYACLDDNSFWRILLRYRGVYKRKRPIQFFFEKFNKQT